MVFASLPSSAPALFYLLLNISNEPNQSELQKSYFTNQVCLPFLCEGCARVLPWLSPSDLFIPQGVTSDHLVGEGPPCPIPRLRRPQGQRILGEAS